jgi:hypothetical protein
MLNTILLVMLIVMIVMIIINWIKSPNFEIYYNDTKYFIQSDWKKNYLLNNNLLDKPLEKSNKIAIITFENRKDIEYINLHNKNLTEYCKKWNYDYLYYDKCIHNVYWCKIYLVLDALKTGKYDYVMWMDSDTIIKNPLLSLDGIVNRYSSDIFVNLDNGSSAYCSGVFIIKNSMAGKSYLEDCIKLNNKNCLSETNEIIGSWAGMCYEQGVMNKLIFEKYYKNTTCLPRYVVLNDAIDEKMTICDYDTFIIHLFASKNDLRQKCFLRYV